MRKGLSDQEHEKFLTHINHQSRNLAAIINDLLDLSRIESGSSFALQKSECHLSNIIHEVAEPFISQEDNHQFELHMMEDTDQIIADRDKIAQVLKNLISNSVKYSPDGGPIKIFEEAFNNSIQVRITDQGIGMRDEEIRQVFNKFYRADTSNNAIEGTGLGMSIAKHIIEAHDGKIWVESEFGSGTSVYFSIPNNSSESP